MAGGWEGIAMVKAAANVARNASVYSKAYASGALRYGDCRLYSDFGNVRLVALVYSRSLPAQV